MNEPVHRVDLVVPTHIPTEQSLWFLRENIRSIVENTPRSLYKLTYVIDRGWDGTEDYLRDCESQGWVDQILRNTSERGFTRTCNIGLEQSKAEFAMLINTDLVVSPGWLEAIVSCFDRNNAGVVGCKLVNRDGTINHAGAYGIGYHKGMNEPNVGYFEEEQSEWVTGAAFAISKKVRDVIGNLDQRYPMWGSDREYCISAREAGFSVWYTPVELLHYGEQSTTQELKDYFKDQPR